MQAIILVRLQRARIAAKEPYALVQYGKAFLTCMRWFWITSRMMPYLQEHRAHDKHRPILTWSEIEFKLDRWYPTRWRVAECIVLFLMGVVTELCPVGARRRSPRQAGEPTGVSILKDHHTYNRDAVSPDKERRPTTFLHQLSNRNA